MAYARLTPMLNLLMRAVCHTSLSTCFAVGFPLERRAVICRKERLSQAIQSALPLSTSANGTKPKSPGAARSSGVEGKADSLRSMVNARC